MSNSIERPEALAGVSDEQLPVPKHKLHGWKHFLGLYAGEHVAATEFVIGATFVALGATTMDILLGLLIGNILAILSWTLITAPIATQTRLSLYTYLNKIAGNSMTKLYNWANVVIFTVISAAMITVSCSAVRFLFGIPAQLDWYPNDWAFVLVVLGVGAIVVLVAMYGFNAVSDFSSICGPWLFVMFSAGALVMFPALAEGVLGRTTLDGFGEFLTIGDQSIWTGVAANGEPGIGLLEVIGFAWAANTITHVGLIDMALFRYAKKPIYGLCTSSGMLFGHFIAWIAAGIMGAGTAILLKKSIIQLDPGDVAYEALGWAGFVIVLVAGWTTANANLYRAGLAAQAIFKNHSRQKTTLAVGLVTVVVACFPFVFTKMLPLLTYAGLIVVPVGAVVFAEHVIFPKIGFTRYWAKYRGIKHSVPAIASWAIGLTCGFGLNILDVMSFYYLFIPTWFVTTISYIILARQFGAAERYPEEEAKMLESDRVVADYQEQQAEAEEEAVKDESFFSRGLHWVSRSSLALIFILAALTMFASPDMEVYTQNRDRFHVYAFIFTVVYFSCAYWALRRKKALQQY
ncbi:purine-cytosine permease family protein [Rubritalea spongiae]|uniref:Purine-cytosine permease family protein n=1 Tax=Rubritalea spongiae TaxID=430797 RepID=A0ABW5E2T1_9BACT